MREREELEWSEEERKAFAELPRETRPDWRLEENLVAVLKSRGVIGHSAPPRFWGRTAPPFAWIGLAAAFGFILFLSGITIGQRWATQTAVESIASLHHDKLLQASARVQQTGSAYVDSLAAFNQLAASEDPQKLLQGREVAIASLYAAASELVRLDPNDPVAARILRGLEQEARNETETGVRKEKKVFWF